MFYSIKLNYKVTFITIFLILLNFLNIYINGITKTREEYLISLYKDKKLLALTFDDGPTKYTNQILDFLDSTDTKATFFLLGEQAEKYPDLVLREYNSNHSVCIHSYTHKFFTKISKEEVIEQIEKTKSVIQNTTQSTPLYIRVPYGIIDDSVKETLKEENVENVLWNVDSLDWKFKNKDQVVEYIKQNTTGNDIILMHDILQSSVDAAKEIIIYYKNLGYEFVTIDEFLEIKNIVKNTK